MIHIYINNKEKKVLGFTFHLFEGEKYVIDYGVYKDHVEMERYLESSKGDVLGINLERFINFCSKNMESKTVLIKEAISDLKKGTNWRSRNRDEYKKFINFVIRADSKMIDLVNSQENENRHKAFMMYKMLTEFVRSEV